MNDYVIVYLEKKEIYLMKSILAAATIITAMAGLLNSPAQAGADGSRQPAGGAHMSSYVSDPSHDPRSLYSQRRGTGQILGQPMFSESAGAHGSRRRAHRHWSSGTFR